MRLEEAESLAARVASRVGSDRPLAQDTLGWIQLARRCCSEAALTFGEVLVAAEELPEPSLVWLREGFVCAREGCDPNGR
jgi:hypothetical protein